jgi:hypothetical protein
MKGERELTLDGIPLDKYTPGETYDLSPAWAEYLIVQGFAISEMRAGSHDGLTKKIVMIAGRRSADLSALRLTLFNDKWKRYEGIGFWPIVVRRSGPCRCSITRPAP